MHLDAEKAVTVIMAVTSERRQDFAAASHHSSNGSAARTMTIKTFAAVVGTLAIIVVLFFITKITTPSRLVAKSGFFAGSSTDDWGRGTGATGFWEPIRVEGRQEQMPQ